MSGGGGNTITEKADPWTGVQPYLLGGGRRLKPGIEPIYSQEGSSLGLDNFSGRGVTPEMKRSFDAGGGGSRALMNPSSDYEEGAPGIFPESQKLYERGGFSPDQKEVTDYYKNQLFGREFSGDYEKIMESGRRGMEGGFDPNITKVGDTSIRDLNTSQVRQGQGALDPTRSLSSLMSGQVSNPYLDDVSKGVTRNIGRNLTENALPAIRSGAVGAGQYGGSRQGLAEGLALSRANQDIASAVAPIYAGAHENAQNRMMGTANAVDQRAIEAANQNLQREMQTQQFNANLGLQNNAQEMARQQQNLSNQAASLQLLGAGQGLQDLNYQNVMGNLQYPTEYDWNNLNRYASIISPGAGMGSVSSRPNNSNTLATLGGLGLTGAQLYGAYGGGNAAMAAGTAGAATAAGTGLASAGTAAAAAEGGAALWGALGSAAMLSDRRLKKDIEPVGVLDNGLTVYRYRYKAGGPLMMGVMADEVKRVNPGAVKEINGYDHVDYGRI